MSNTNLTTSIQRAMTKARQIAATGVAPRFIGWAGGSGRLYKVASASHSNHEYVVTAKRVAKGFATECECEAARRGLVCHHRAQVQLYLADRVGAYVAPMAAD